MNRKLFALVIVLFISNFSLLLSYSSSGKDSILPNFLTDNVPLFVEQIDQIPRILTIHAYYTRGLLPKSTNIFFLPNQIMTAGKMNDIMLAGFLLRYNKLVQKEEAINLARLYIEEARVEGVNHDIAFSQMCHETGFLRYDGTVRKYQNNFCGLGTVNIEIPGEAFDSQEEGIRAHIQHLKAYATTEALNMDKVDARFKYVKRGSAPTINDLTGKWATDPQYGKKINRLLTRLYSI